MVPSRLWILVENLCYLGDSLARGRFRYLMRLVSGVAYLCVLIEARHDIFCKTAH